MLPPEELSPPYWINMGAVAIATLTGALLIERAVMCMWRYLLQGAAFRYSPLHWGGVFPMGMYDVFTRRLIQVLPLRFFAMLSKRVVFSALLTWRVTLTALTALIDCLFFGRFAPIPCSRKAAK